MYINKEKMEHLSKLRDDIIKYVTAYFNPDPWKEQGYLYYETMLERTGGAFKDFKRRRSHSSNQNYARNV